MPLSERLARVDDESPVADLGDNLLSERRPTALSESDLGGSGLKCLASCLSPIDSH